MKKISFNKSELVKEHKHLIKVLRGNNKKAFLREANKQAKELKLYIKKKMK